MEYFTLRTGARMPAIGCGTVTFGRANDDLAGELTGDFSALDTAVEQGYRLFDTALAYGNEEGIGERIAANSIPRDQLFLSSKIPNRSPYNQTRESVRASVNESLRRMRTDYFDMMLIHQAVPPELEKLGGEMDVERTCELWDALAELMDEGKLLGIGVSNFNIAQLQVLIDNCREIPMVDQIRCNPAIPNNAVIAFCKERGIIPEAHSPLNFSVSRGVIRRDPAYMALLEECGERHGKSWAQVILRYNYQNGLISIPRSAKPAHQAANLQIFDFSLTPDEMIALYIPDKSE